jgi:enoyl reductase-like protein
VAALNFDTLEYVKQLTDAGVERQVAEIHAITVGRAMGMYVNNLVTQEYLDATLDARFAEQDLRIEKRFAEQDAKFEQRFNKAEIDMRVLKWGQAIVVAAVLLPQLSKLVV